MPPRLACVRSRTPTSGRPFRDAGNRDAGNPASGACGANPAGHRKAPLEIPAAATKPRRPCCRIYDSIFPLQTQQNFYFVAFIPFNNPRSLRSHAPTSSAPLTVSLAQDKTVPRLWTLCPPPGAFSMLASAWRLPFPAAQSAAPYSVRRCFWHPVSVHRFARSGSPD